LFKKSGSRPKSIDQGVIRAGYSAASGALPGVANATKLTTNHEIITREDVFIMINQQVACSVRDALMFNEK
jgi:hypothetical protein